MQYLTLLDIKNVLNADLDLDGEVFVTSDELRGYINAGIKECEGLIHTLHEDYFLSEVTLPLLGGVRDYDMPLNIFANKVRYIWFSDGSDEYQIRRVRPEKAVYSRPGDKYSYMVVNNAGSGVKLRVLPTPQSDDPAGITFWFIRSANKLILDTDVCDIPEFVNYVILYCKVEIMKKEGHPMLMFTKEQKDAELASLKEVLSSMTYDGSENLPMDLSAYSDMS